MQLQLFILIGICFFQLASGELCKAVYFSGMRILAVQPCMYMYMSTFAIFDMQYV